MSTEGIQSTWGCPECDRENLPADVRCWLCFAPRPGAAAVADRPPPLRRPLGDDRDDDYPELPGTASLYESRLRTASLHERRLPIVTAILIIVVCLLLTLAYGLGLAMLLILTPALVRLFRVGRARSAEPAPESRNPALQIIPVMIPAPLIAMLVVVSAFITFVAVCFPAGFWGFENNSPYVPAVAIAGWVFGILLASSAGYLVVFLFFRPTPRFCPRCGVKNPRAATACRFCGAAMPPLTGPNSVQGR